MNALFNIAGHFIDPKTIGNIEPLGNGLINDTYKIMVKGEAKPKYVLQRIHNAVFAECDWSRLRCCFAACPHRQTRRC